MGFLEIIKLRSAECPFDVLTEQIDESICVDGEQNEVVTIYRHTGLATDLAIHISHSGDFWGGVQSELGLRLAAALKEFGLVEHTVWEKMHRSALSP